ncbi:hypothetical protein GCM10020219_077990 [Nonomuraea dietziae]
MIDIEVAVPVVTGRGGRLNVEVGAQGLFHWKDQAPRSPTPRPPQVRTHNLAPTSAARIQECAARRRGDPFPQTPCLVQHTPYQDKWRFKDPLTMRREVQKA